MTYDDMIAAFGEFVQLFPEDARKQVFESKAYAEWAVKNQNWLMTDGSTRVQDRT